MSLGRSGHSVRVDSSVPPSHPPFSRDIIRLCGKLHLLTNFPSHCLLSFHAEKPEYFLLLDVANHQKAAKIRQQNFKLS